MRKVWGFGDSILKGAVLSEGPAVKYALLPEGFLERGLLPGGFEVCNHARFGSTIVLGGKIFGRHLGRQSGPTRSIPRRRSPRSRTSRRHIGI